MEKIIEEAYRAMLENGTLEKIVAKKLEDMAESACRDLMGYGGPVKKEFEKRLEPLMIRAIEQSDLNELAVKLTDVINQGLRESGLAAYGEVLAGVKRLCDAPERQYSEKATLQDILDAYVDYIQRVYDEHDFDDADINEDDGAKTASLECQLSMTDPNAERWFSSVQKRVITLENPIGRGKKDETCYQFSLRHSSYSDRWVVRTEFNYNVRDLRRMSTFEIYLMQLEQSCTAIDISGDSELEEEANFEFER